MYGVVRNDKDLSEQRKDGTILYSCGGTNSEYEELRLLEVTSQQDTLIYVNRSGSEIVNASLSPNREVIAFTTLHHQNLSDVTSKESKSQVQDDAPDSDDSDDGVSEDDYDGSNHAENWQYSSNGNNDNDAKVEQETLHTQKSAIQMIKGKYSSYIADTYPTKWTKKFDISQSLYQKVIFTDCNITKTENGVRIRENRLLFVMHRKYIGLYSILLKPNVDKEPEKISAHTSVKKWIMYCAPRSVVIARRPLWSQWDGVNQRLYFVTVSRDKSIKTKPQVTYSTTFSCEQFIQSDAWTRRMFSFKVDFCLNRDVIARKTSEYFLAEMDPTVSSREINMKILNLMSGGICLVWQTLFYSNSGDRSLYKIALLDKDMVLSCLCDEKLDYYEKDPLQERFSFSSHGNNILIHVHGHNSFMHYLTVDCVTRKNDRLHHCHFLSETASFRTLKNIQQFPFLVDVDGNKVKSLYTIFVWDAISKSVFKLQLNREKMEQLCFDLEVPIENRLAAMRFGSLAFEDFSVREDNLREFLSIGMILNGDKFLGTLLIQFATTEVCMKFPDVQFLRNLLPLSVQLSTEDTRSFALSVKCCEIKENIQSQISSQAEEDVSISLSWKSTLLAFKCGHFVPCDLQAFSNEMEFLESPKLLKSQKDLMQNELNDIYEKEVSKPASHDGEKGKYNCDYSCEQNHSLENLMTLTYMKLTDHLKEALGNDKLAKHIARNFVMEQQRAADHFVTLFIFSTIVDDDDKSLLTPVNNQERQLLHLLRRMLCTCLNIYFPPPIGLQTRLTCLTFRYCVTAHITEGNFDYDFAETSESNGMNESSSSQGKFPACFKSEDINALSFEFFQLVDTKCIHVTGEFVAKLLEDLPDHEAFGGFIQQVLRRAHFQSENVSDSAMELWNHPYAWASLARNAMKRLSHLTGFDVIQTSAKSSGKRDVSPSTEPSHFEPLDVFLNDVQRCGEDADVCVTTVANATFQGVIRKHGKENLRHIAC